MLYPTYYAKNYAGIMGAVLDPSNFRPISVVPIIAELLEKIVSIQFSRYLEQNQLLNPHQGAF